MLWWKWLIHSNNGTCHACRPPSRPGRGLVFYTVECISDLSVSVSGGSVYWKTTPNWLEKATQVPITNTDLKYWHRPTTNLSPPTCEQLWLHACTFVSVCVDAVKYLGLMAMSKILKTHPKSVQAHKDLILQCLDDKDESIRLRALDLLYGMVRRPSCDCHLST